MTGVTPPPASGAVGPADAGLPEAAERRLQSDAFSSHLTIPDFGACLNMGLRPVGLVQGFCTMQWAWYGAGSPYLRGLNPCAPSNQYRGIYSESYQCPHAIYTYSNEHRTWGQNYEQPWVEEAWTQGYGAAFERMVTEAVDLGAHGVIGISHRIHHLSDTPVTEFHLLGTAVVVEGGPAPSGGRPWTTFLSGQRLGKLFEAGFAPVSVAAALSSVRVWAYCVTEFLMEGGTASWVTQYSGRQMGQTQWTYGPREVEQVSSAHMAARDLVRRAVRNQLGGDTLHGASIDMVKRELGSGDSVIECTLFGTRVRRFKDFDPMAPPTPTVRLS